ncbi:hypothetical protein [Prevotella merdae]|uniref:hypothetical protein n=1 Tax=Prevotella merdae TaxID=2079531 RepID=UPI003568BA03
MPYNWKCCSFYPNNFGASALFGVNLHWKMVGLGYEYRTSSAEYKHFNTENFGKDKTKFKSGTSKFYITFRF